MHIQHAVVWLDHREAKVFLLDREGFERATISTELPHHQTHNKAGTIDGKRTAPDQSYYQEIVSALEPAAEWLIVGLSLARDELVSHIRSHDPQLAERVIGVESADHPTDREAARSSGTAVNTPGFGPHPSFCRSGGADRATSGPTPGPQGGRCKGRQHL